MSLLPVRTIELFNHAIHFLMEAVMKFEFPPQKPMMQYRNAIGSMQALLDILAGLRKIREHIPVREAVSGVVHERRELVRGCPSHGPTSVRLMHEATHVIGILCMHLVVCL